MKSGGLAFARATFLAAGCHGYISKPIDVKTFVAEIEAICKPLP